MLFNSFEFVALTVLTFVLYYLPGLANFQVLILILSSLFFYAYGEPVWVLLLLLSVSINIAASYYVVYGNPARRKLYAILGVGLNLLVLIFFKYSPLFGRAFFGNTDSVGHFLVSIPLPIGISFFTFQGISLVVDVYREKYSPNRELIPASVAQHAKRILFFKSFFPQLVAGPIVKAHDFLPQIGKKTFSSIDWEYCFRNLVMGYFLKMVVADNLKNFTFWIQYPYFKGHSRSTLITMLLGYSFQIFADFAGYSLIALGLAKLFGYRFPDNFNFPYISTSFREFWKRWHISLSSFLMEYLYIPLGGNRKGKVRTYVNLMITMILGGLWHGAAWSYAVWGFFHGAALAIERFIDGRYPSKAGGWFAFLRGVLVFGFVTMAWLLFKLPDFSHVIEYARSIYTNSGEGDAKIIQFVFLYSLPVVLYHMAYLSSQQKVVFSLHRLDFLVYGVLLFLIITNSGTSGSFIYFQF